MRLAPDGEIQFRGRTVFSGYWNAPELTKAAFTEDGWYRTGDLGRFDDEGRLILSGRTQGHDRAAERLQRVSRGHRERAAHRRACAMRSSSRPSPGGSRRSSWRSTAEDRPRRRRPGSTPRSRPRTGRSARTSASRAGGCGRTEDFPRTHTLKIKRDPIRRWVATEAPLPANDRRRDRRPSGRDRHPGAERLERGLDVGLSGSARPRAPTSTGRRSSRPAG